MQKRGKKAVSQIVTTILIILLVLAAIVIIWQAIKGTVKEKSEEIDVEILAVDVDIEKTSVYIDETGGKLQLSISRGADNVQISSIKFIIEGEINNKKTSKIYILSETENSFPKALETKTYVFDLDGLTKISKVSIYPVSQKGKVGIKEEYATSGQESSIINSNLPVIKPQTDEGDNCGNGQCAENENCNSCPEDCGNCLTKPYYEQTEIYNDIYNSPWFAYNYGGVNYLVSPMIDAGAYNEMLHHKVTVDYTATNGNVKVSIGHYSQPNFEYVMSYSYRHTSFANVVSGQELKVATQYRSERYAWVILEITGDAVVTKVSHTHWVGFNTEYGHEAKEFNFVGGTLRYRMLYPKNYDSSSGKKYPLVISVGGSGGVGCNNEAQMEMIQFGRFLFGSYYSDEEFEAFSIVPQVPTTSCPVPSPYYPTVPDGQGAPEYPYHPSWAGVNENGFFADAIHALVNEMLADPQLNIDENRVYVTGHSLGGKAVYELMKEMPDILAAAWSSAGWAIGSHYIDYTSYPDNDPMIIRLKEEIDRYKHLPVQVSAGSTDINVPSFGGQLACDKINSQGGNCNYLFFLNCNHDCSATRSWGTRGYVSWLFNQHK